MTPTEKLKELEDRLWDYEIDAREDIRWLITRVKKLTEALEEVAMQQSDLPMVLNARKALNESSELEGE